MHPIGLTSNCSQPGNQDRVHQTRRCPYNPRYAAFKSPFKPSLYDLRASDNMVWQYCPPYNWRLYAFFLSYLAGPVVGAPIDSAHIIDFVHSLPEWAKYTGKTIAAAPFVYHSLNGLRHLTWDTTRCKSPFLSRIVPSSDLLTVLNNAAVTRSGYAVVAGTIIGTGALVLL
ncbi:5531_t:CDS:2 [Acaulospora colombiana]|uniref:5531_t:CDS:1 n=1 Tax=Acaulospora colombiana TaxID=27376 RepID=A0ACA9PWY4_9GLOM|nr:5531_t:CDS:2 [Acaulospora colombiana]